MTTSPLLKRLVTVQKRRRIFTLTAFQNRLNH